MEFWFAIIKYASATNAKRSNTDASFPAESSRLSVSLFSESFSTQEEDRIDVSLDSRTSVHSRTLSPDPTLISSRSESGIIPDRSFNTSVSLEQLDDSSDSGLFLFKLLSYVLLESFALSLLFYFEESIVLFFSEYVAQY